MGFRRLIKNVVSNVESDLADSLVKMRVDAGLTQKELSKRLNITQSSLSRYESGESEIKLKTYLSMTIACGLDASLHISKFSEEKNKEALKDGT